MNPLYGNDTLILIDIQAANHLMVDYPPTKSVLEMVGNFKSISTFRIYKKHRAFLKGHFWKENTFWSDGYFTCSIGEASPETIKKYIETQG